MEKDQAETERVVNGVAEREMKSDIDDLKQKIKDAESENETKQRKVHVLNVKAFINFFSYNKI